MSPYPIHRSAVDAPLAAQPPSSAAVPFRRRALALAVAAAALGALPAAHAFDAAIELSALDGSNGFALNGVAAFDNSGAAVAGAGDVNGDGIDDLIVGADWADPNGNYSSGQSYVVFGANGGFAASLELSALDGSNGFALNGVAEEDRSGRAVAGLR